MFYLYEPCLARIHWGSYVYKNTILLRQIHKTSWLHINTYFRDCIRLYQYSVKRFNVSYHNYGTMSHHSSITISYTNNNNTTLWSYYVNLFIFKIVYFYTWTNALANNAATHDGRVHPRVTAAFGHVWPAMTSLTRTSLASSLTDGEMGRHRSGSCCSSGCDSLRSRRPDVDFEASPLASILPVGWRTRPIQTSYVSTQVGVGGYRKVKRHISWHSHKNNQCTVECNTFR